LSSCGARELNAWPQLGSARDEPSGCNWVEAAAKARPAVEDAHVGYRSASSMSVFTTAVANTMQSDSTIPADRSGFHSVLFSPTRRPGYPSHSRTKFFGPHEFVSESVDEVKSGAVAEFRRHLSDVIPTMQHLDRSEQAQTPAVRRRRPARKRDRRFSAFRTHDDGELYNLGDIVREAVASGSI